MISKIDNSTLLASWGFTTLIGWISTVLMGAAGTTSGKVMIVWTVLMTLPILITLKLVFDGDSNKLFNFWALAVTILMIENLLTPTGLAIYSYFHLWYLAAIIGFYYTSSKLPPPSDRTYRYASFLSLIGFALVVYKPLIAAPLGIVLQGGPMIYDWYTVHR